MTHRQTIQHRAGPLFGALLVLVAVVLAFTPIVPRVGAVDSTPAPSVDPSASPSPDPSPSADPSASPSPDPSAEPSPSPSPSPSPEPVRGTLDLTSNAPAGGRHRIDPSSVLSLALSARVETPAKSVQLVVQLPAGWTVVDPDGGVVDSAAQTIAWFFGDVKDAMQTVVAPRLRAPLGSPGGDRAITATFAARLEHADGIVARDSVSVLVAPELIVEHSVFAVVEPVSQAATYLGTDTALTGVVRFDAFRVRFQVRNADLQAAGFVPDLQYRLGGAATFADVPVGGSVAGVPLYVGAEWRRTGAGTGTLPGPAQEPIGAGELIVRDTDDATQAPVAGRRVMGRSGTSVIAPPGDSYTEVEFTVRASIDLPLGAWFELRLTDGGQAIPGAATASMASESTPRVQLTPGQRYGVAVGRPVDVHTANPPGVASVDVPLVSRGVIAASWTNPGGLPIYRLAVALPTAPKAEAPLNDTSTSPHEPDTSLTSDTCAECHSTHTATDAYLVTASGGSVAAAGTTSQLRSVGGTSAPSAANSAMLADALCLTCHEGTTGASLSMAALYGPAAPTTDPGARDIYSHDVALDPSLKCATCHNPHIATAAPAIQTTTGWAIAGAQISVGGTVATNGGANTTPTYTIQDGSYGHQPTREYELCLKCHTGAAVASNAGQPPSQDELDKGVELNPSNSSYHPVEASGKNTTVAMALSLAGTSPYKLWNFTTDGTVRCVNCHADSAKYDPTTPPAAGSDLAPHTSQYRGILIQNYQDRVLKSSGVDYAAADSALCLVCHAEEGFVSNSSSATNFRLHQEHLTGIAGKGNGGTNIDTPGDGQGNAICAECHFRIHGTALAYQVGDRTNKRLVNFAPNVLPDGDSGVLKWTSTGVGTGTCTLTCHGYDHQAKAYGP